LIINNVSLFFNEDKKGNCVKAFGCHLHNFLSGFKGFKGDDLLKNDYKIKKVIGQSFRTGKSYANLKM